MYLIIMLIALILFFTILGIYNKTEHPLASAWAWAIIVGLINMFSHGMSYYLFLAPISFFLGWGLFSLAKSLEEHLLFRTLVHIVTMFFIFSTVVISF